MKIITNLLMALIVIMAVIFIHDEVSADSTFLAGPIQTEVFLRNYSAALDMQVSKFKDISLLLNKKDFPELNMKVLDMVGRYKTQRCRMTLI